MVVNKYCFPPTYFEEILIILFSLCLAVVFEYPVANMKTQVTIFLLFTFVACSRTNTLVRRVDECLPEFLEYPSSVNVPCGNNLWLQAGCVCCPSKDLGCASPAVCTQGLTAGLYICAVSGSGNSGSGNSGSGTSGSGTSQCIAGQQVCGTTCIPATADCCNMFGNYCSAPLQCGTRTDGSMACFTSGRTGTTSSQPTTASNPQITTTSPVTPAGSGNSASPRNPSFGRSLKTLGAAVISVMIFVL
jgi:hypothetical protein